jgi:hypothetical protein
MTTYRHDKETTPRADARGGKEKAMTTRDAAQRVIELVRNRLAAGGIDHVVVATTSGETGVRFAESLGGLDIRVACVTHHVGFQSGDIDQLEPGNRARLEELGAHVVTAGHALSGVGRSISTAFGGASPPEVIAHTLRLFGQGMKVCVEIAVMAADAGAVPTDRDVLCVGGTGRGADTAVVLKPSHMNRFFEMRIREILCFPSGT